MPLQIPGKSFAPAAAAAPAAPAQKRSLFAGIGAARTMLDTSYFKEGRYWMRIDKGKQFENRNHLARVGIEGTIIKVLDDHQGRSHRAGESVSHLYKRENEYFDREIKTFICMITGAAEEQVTEELGLQVADAIFPEGSNAPQPMAMKVVEVVARLTKTKKDTDFTRVSFVREVPASEVLGGIAPADAVRFFPAGYLEAEASKEAEQAKAA